MTKIAKTNRQSHLQPLRKRDPNRPSARKRIFDTGAKSAERCGDAQCTNVRVWAGCRRLRNPSEYVPEAQSREWHG